jgi:hypothetical protein
MFRDNTPNRISKSDTDEKVPAGAFVPSIVFYRVFPDRFIQWPVF